MCDLLDKECNVMCDVYPLFRTLDICHVVSMSGSLVYILQCMLSEYLFGNWSNPNRVLCQWLGVVI